AVHGQALDSAHEHGFGLTYFTTSLAVFEHSHRGVLHEIFDLVAVAAAAGQDAAHLLEGLRPAAAHDRQITPAGGSRKQAKKYCGKDGGFSKAGVSTQV